VMHPYCPPAPHRLPHDSAERKALTSLLGTRAGLEWRASRWTATHRREPKPEAKQLGL
jgi:hypothetical protein